MRVGIVLLALKTNILQQFHCAFPAHFFAVVCVNFKNFFDSFAHCFSWVKAGCRVLENHLHIFSQAAHFFLCKLCKVYTCFIVVVKLALIFFIQTAFCNRQNILTAHRKSLCLAGEGSITILFNLFFRFMHQFFNFCRRCFAFCNRFSIFCVISVIFLYIFTCVHSCIVGIFVKFLDFRQLCAENKTAYCTAAFTQLTGSVLFILLGLKSQFVSFLCKPAAFCNFLLCAMVGQSFDFFIKSFNLFVNFKGFFVVFISFFLIIKQFVYLFADILRRNFLDTYAVVNTGTAGLTVKLKDYTAKCGFAAAAFANNAKLFAFVDFKTYILQGLEVYASFYRKVFFKFIQFN